MWMRWYVDTISKSQSQTLIALSLGWCPECPGYCPFRPFIPGVIRAITLHLILTPVVRMHPLGTFAFSRSLGTCSVDWRART